MLDTEKFGHAPLTVASFYFAISVRRKLMSEKIAMITAIDSFYRKSGDIQLMIYIYTPQALS